MNDVTIFWMQILVSASVVAIIAAWYVWPPLTKRSRNAALAPLLWVHVPRFLGTTLLVTGMIDPRLPREFLSNGAYGDLLVAALALVAIFTLRFKWRGAVALVWVTNVLGVLDLLNGFRGTIQLNVPTFNLGTIWYFYIVYGPMIIASHVMIFVILAKSRSWKID